MMDKNKAFGLMGVVLLVLLVAPSTLGYVITSKGKPEPDTLIAWPDEGEVRTPFINRS
jgi:hypothetical protein